MLVAPQAIVAVAAAVRVLSLVALGGGSCCSSSSRSSGGPGNSSWYGGTGGNVTVGVRGDAVKDGSGGLATIIEAVTER